MNRNQLSRLFSTDAPLFNGGNAAQQASLNAVQRIISKTAVELPGVPQNAAPDSSTIATVGNLAVALNQIVNSGPSAYLLTWPYSARRLSGAILKRTHGDLFNRAIVAPQSVPA